jgi:hypothetical protein
MADEQIIVDIEVDSDEVKKAEKRIDELTDSIEELAAKIKDAKNRNAEFQAKVNKLNDELADGNITIEERNKELEKLIKQQHKDNVFIAESTVELQKQKRERTANIKVIQSEENSRERLRQRVALLTKEYNSLNLETVEGRKRSEQLQKELKQLNEELNEGSKAAGNFKDNIGNYPEAAEGAIISLQGVGDGMEQVGGSSAQAVGGIKTLGNAFKALLANPVVLVLAAIVAGLSALFSAFKKSASGARIMDKASAVLDGTMAVLTKKMNELGEAAEQSFKKGEDGTVGFWEALKKNVVYKFQSVIELFKAVGDGLKALWEGNTEAIEKASEKAKEALIGIVTGQTSEQLEKIADKFKETAKEANELTQAFLKLADAQLKGRASARNLEKGIAQTSAELERLTEIAGDDTRAMSEQREAAIKAGEVAQKLAMQEKALAGTRLALINQEVAVRRSAGQDIQDLLDEQADAYLAYVDAQSRAAVAAQKIAIEQRKIERDIFEQNLDILIDVGDKIKTEREKQIQDESLSLDKRKQLLEGARAALEANFDAIKKEYELYGVTAEQINEVISASDAKQANEKLKALGLNEIANNRLREIILERRQAELDFNDLQKDLSDEEISRKEKANDKIQQINEDRILSQIDNEEELKNKLIELEEAKRKSLLQSKILTKEERQAILENETLTDDEKKTLLEDKTLLEEEKQAIILESEEKIKEIENEFADKKEEKEKEKLKRRKELIQESLDNIVSITEKFAGKEAALFGKIAVNIGKAFEDGKLTATEAINGITSITQASFDAIQERRDIDLQNIELKRQKELELAGDNLEAQVEINRRYDREAAVIKLKQFKADKAKALVDIAIQTAVAVVKALPNVPLSITIGALGAVQAGIVASKQPPKFKKGVNDIVSIGGSHESGRDVDVFGVSGNQTQYFGKVEKGEVMPVIRKSAINDYMIAKLNGSFSPNKRIFQTGTPDITNVNQQSLSAEDIAAAFKLINLSVKVEDITKEIAKKVEVVDNSKV